MSLEKQSNDNDMWWMNEIYALVYVETWLPLLMPIVAWYWTRYCALSSRNRYWQWKKQWMTELATTCKKELDPVSSESLPVPMPNPCNAVTTTHRISTPLTSVSVVPVVTVVPANTDSQQSNAITTAGRMMDIWRGREYALPDVLHWNATKCLLAYRWIGDVAVHIYPALAVLLAPHPWKPLACQLAIGYLFRTPFFSMTVLIPCNPKVHITASDWRQDHALPPSSSRLAWEGFGIDLIFSGHVHLMTTGLFVLCNEAQLSFDIRAALTISAILVSIWIVISHCHYSVCVAVSWLASSWLYDHFYPLWNDLLIVSAQQPVFSTTRYVVTMAFPIVLLVGYRFLNKSSLAPSSSPSFSSSSSSSSLTLSSSSGQRIA